METNVGGRKSSNSASYSMATAVPFSAPEPKSKDRARRKSAVKLAEAQQANYRDLAEILRQYRTPNLTASLWQVGSTLVFFFSLVAVMWLSLQWSYLITLVLSVPAAFFLVRLFIIQHDCGHGSFFQSRWANDWMGRCLSILTLSGYQFWRKSHAAHHASVGDLDRRGVGGDVNTLTVKEYEKLSPRQKLAYRVLRNPIIFFGILPTLVFVVLHRFPYDVPRTWKRERRSIWWNNLGVGLFVVGMCWLMGIVPFFLVFTPTVIIGSTVGFWLFYVQHQFEDTYWDHRKKWDYTDACLQGSSHYRLPKVLQWLTASIGIHHIHHLDSNIPNYRLQQCHDENPEFQTAPVLTLWQSLRCVSFKLWDEDQRKMVGFSKHGKKNG